MPRGGKREKAGRPPGAKSQKTKVNEERIKAAVESGITPLEVMLNAMRGYYETGDMQAAVDVAKDAAPYIHPKLAAITTEANVQGTMTIRWEGSNSGSSYTLRAEKVTD